MGWGGFLDKALGLFPGRKERYRRKIRRLKGQMDDLISKEKMSARDVGNYQRLADELSEAESNLQDSA